MFRKDGTAQGVVNRQIINDHLAERFVLGAGLIKLMGHKFSVWLAKLMGK